MIFKQEDDNQPNTYSFYFNYVGFALFSIVFFMQNIKALYKFNK